MDLAHLWGRSQSLLMHSFSSQRPQSDLCLSECIWTVKWEQVQWVLSDRASCEAWNSSMTGKGDMLCIWGAEHITELATGHRGGALQTTPPPPMHAQSPDMGTGPVTYIHTSMHSSLQYRTTLHLGHLLNWLGCMPHIQSNRHHSNTQHTPVCTEEPIPTTHMFLHWQARNVVALIVEGRVLCGVKDVEKETRVVSVLIRAI